MQRVKNGTSSVGQRRMELIQFSLHLVDFVTVEVCCEGSAWFQKVVVNHAPPLCYSRLFCWILDFGFGKCLGRGGGGDVDINLVADRLRLSCRTQLSSHVTTQFENGSV